MLSLLWTDRQTNRQTDRVIPIYPPNFVCGGYNKDAPGDNKVKIWQKSPKTQMPPAATKSKYGKNLLSPKF